MDRSVGSWPNRQLSINDIYSATEYSDPNRPETLTSILLGIPLHLQQSQIGLLLPDLPLEQLLPATAIVQRLANQNIGPTTFVRLQVSIPASTLPNSAADEFTFWIDPSAPAIRRIELPTASMFDGLPHESRPQNAKLVLDLEEAVFDGTMADSLFATTAAKESRFVRYFVVPPLPLPSDLFGTEVGELEFTTLDQQREKSSHWKGKQAVLIWFDGHEESRRSLAEIEKVYRQFKPHRNRVVFRAISVDDPKQTSDRQVRTRLNDWRITFPAARDNLAVGRDQLSVESAPTVVVYGDDQKLHFFSVGADPDIAENVSLVVQGLLQKTDVGAGVVKQFESEQRAFQRQLAIASVERPKSFDSAPTSIAKKSAPKKLRLSELWVSNSVPSPGNLLALQNDEGHFETLVIDGLREIVKLNNKGDEVERFKPKLAADDVISQLRHFQTRGGKRRFAAWSTLGKRVYVLDAAMKTIFEYPKTAHDHPGIQDVLLGDLDSDEDVELYVAFRDPVGLHRVSNGGKRIWSNRRITGIASIAIDPAGFGRLLVCGNAGDVHPIFFGDGRAEKPIVVAGRSIHSLSKTASKSTRPDADDGHVVYVGRTV